METDDRCKESKDDVTMTEGNEGEWTVISKEQRKAEECEFLFNSL
jgi:hypothetical protein